MKLAIIGSGISGLTCAYLLAERHDVTLFEKDNRLGGHTSTVAVEHEGRTLAVDTGFIVFNERNYPDFCRLIARLGVASRPTTMSFSVKDEGSGFEYGGERLAGVIGSVSNLARPRWWSVIRSAMRLRSTGRAALADLPPETTVGMLLESGRFSRAFLDGYLLPMAAAVWSAPRDDLMRFPARFILRFFDNHGMLDHTDRLQWRTIAGGSRTYIDAMMSVLASRARVGHGVESIRRSPSGVTVRTAAGDERFDEVIIAAHSDESLRLLADPTAAEHAVLGAMPYQPNDVVLHSDRSLLPSRKRCWAAWNYIVADDPSRPAIVTYNMSMLQGLATREPLCVTLNATERISPGKIIKRFSYAHPLYTVEGELARSRWAEISGVNRTHYCGAYWGNGFHEDGVSSALRVCERLGGGL